MKNLNNITTGLDWILAKEQEALCRRITLYHPFLFSSLNIWYCLTVQNLQWKSLERIIVSGVFVLLLDWTSRDEKGPEKKEFRTFPTENRDHVITLWKHIWYWMGSKSIFGLLQIYFNWPKNKRLAKTCWVWPWCCDKIQRPKSSWNHEIRHFFKGVKFYFCQEWLKEEN